MQPTRMRLWEYMQQHRPHPMYAPVLELAFTASMAARPSCFCSVDMRCTSAKFLSDLIDVSRAMTPNPDHNVHNGANSTTKVTGASPDRQKMVAASSSTILESIYGAGV